MTGRRRGRGDLAEKVTKVLGGSDKPVEPEKPEEKTTIKWFRVRKIWKDSKTQKQLTEMCRKAV